MSNFLRLLFCVDNIILRKTLTVHRLFHFNGTGKN